MQEKEYIEKAHNTVNEWFKDHQATVIGGDAFAWSNGLTQIAWKRPNTSNYGVQYTVFGGYVVVTGDLGDAIYAVSSVLTFDRLLQLDWHYFWNKCVASEKGREYTQKVPGIKSPVPNIRAIAHFVGLQSAIKQLKAREVEMAKMFTTVSETAQKAAEAVSGAIGQVSQAIVDAHTKITNL